MPKNPARAVDTIAASIGDDTGKAILSRDMKLAKQEVQQLAQIAAVAAADKDNS